MQRARRPILKHLLFDWKSPNKYHELSNLDIKVRNIVLTNNNSLQDSKKVTIVIKMLGHEGLRLFQTLNDRKQKKM